MELNFKKLDNLVPAVVQDQKTRRVLMVGFMNVEAYRHTVETGDVTFFSRTRNKLWVKGETSGHTITVKEIQTDCDQDCLLLLVEANGPGVCHEGYESCFFRTLKDGVWELNAEPRFNPKEVYGGQ